MEEIQLTKVNGEYDVDYHVVGQPTKSTTNKMSQRRIKWIKISCVIVLVLILGVASYMFIDFGQILSAIFSRQEILPDKNETLSFDSSIDELRYYIDRDDYLRSRNLTDDFLTRFLVARSDNSRRTFNLVQNYFKMRREHPELFMTATEAYSYAIPPIFYHQHETTLNNDSIIYLKMANWQYEWQDYAKAMATSVPFSEVSILKHGNNRSALSLVDMRGWSWGHFLSAPVDSVKLVFELTERTLPIKPSKMHIFHNDWLSEQLFKIGQIFVEYDKMQDIIYHGSDLSAIKDLVPLSSLPEPLGGEASLREWTRHELEEYDRILVDYYTRFPA